jgi:Putative Ig domain
VKVIEATRQAGRRINRKMRAMTVTGVLVSAGSLALAAVAAAGPATAGTGAARSGALPGAAVPGSQDYRSVCPPAPPGQAACTALIRTDLPHHLQPASAPDTPPVGYGYGPPSLQNAYVLPSSTAGSGETVAVIDSSDDPNAAADLATYRSAWGLPPCGSGCFTKVNQNGQASPLPPPDSGWATEESSDLDMVSAICPNCNILLVEADGSAANQLGAAVDTAVAMGAKFVSNSYSSQEYPTETSTDSYYNHPGVAVTVSAGDSGFGVSYPAASQYVISVGGTSLTPAANSRGWNETVWGSAVGGEGTGSGCSAYEAKPSWQTDTGCALRTDNDVAAVANPNTGVAVYDTYAPNGGGGWHELGGTSVASPIIASVFALAGTPAAGTYPSSYIYEHLGSLFDITSGANGTCSPAYLCTAEIGYDGPTGWGTPDGTGDFLGDVVTVTNPGPQGSYRGFPATLQITAASSRGFPLTYQATGLPIGMVINPATGLISGAPTYPGNVTVTVTATDSHCTQGSATFTWTVDWIPHCKPITCS